MLRYTFVVTEATTPIAAIERVGELPFACVVCIANGDYRIRDFLDAIARAAPLDAAHVLFVVPRAVASDVVIYSRSDGSKWLRASALPTQLAAITQIIETLRHQTVLTPSRLAPLHV
jgi:hypothetical protein